MFERIGLKLDQIDVIELNDPALALAVLRDLGPPTTIRGLIRMVVRLRSAIHWAQAARMAATALNQLERTGCRYALHEVHRRGRGLLWR